MDCPKCGRRMTIGSPHYEDYAYQYECFACGEIIPVMREDLGED